jgi:WD40 repeat protein
MASPGAAQATLSFDAWKEGKVAPTRHEVPVIAPRPESRLQALQAVSSRLRKTLIHPNRRGTLHGLRYAPDGKQLIAADYPGGDVLVWDSETGKQRMQIETGFSWDQHFVSPDWKVLYKARLTRRKHSRLERDGKPWISWDCAGEVRAWDLATGRLSRIFRHSPPRGIDLVTLAPDGATFVTSEEVSGQSPGRPKCSSSLWPVKTGRYRLLPEDLSRLVVYSPDSRTLAAVALQEERFMTAIRLFDSTTAQRKLSIPLAGERFPGLSLAFSPDGRLLAGQFRNYMTGQSRLKLWDAATGGELAVIEGAKNEYFGWLMFSPDGGTLAAANARVGTPSKLFLFDVPGRKLVKTVLLEEKAMVRALAFSPDSRWLAVPTQAIPADLRRPEPEEVPQPRIHLLDVAAGVVRETLVAPPAFTISVCFSPDGKTLAAGGLGKVLLFDMTKRPGLTSAGQRNEGE